MSQYNSRLFIRVEYPSRWKLLHSLELERYNLEISAQELFGTKKKAVVVTDWSCSEKQLEDMVREIVKHLKECVIIADTTDFNVNPYEFGVYYLGQKVNTFMIEEPEPGYDMFTTVGIEDVAGWLKKANCAVSTGVRRYLERFGIQCEVNKASVPKKEKYSVRFYFSNRNLMSAMAMTPFLDTKRILLDELTNKGYMFSADIALDEAAFEVPKQTTEDIENYMKILSGRFYHVYSVAWDGKSEFFIIRTIKTGQIAVKEVSFSDLDLKLGINIFKDSLHCLQEVIDIQKLESFL